MSQHKFASNVVEKCLTFGSVEERDIIVQSMLGKGSSEPAPSMDGQDPFQKMMLDQFGNYVVQKVLEVCDDTQRSLVMAHVRTQTEALKKQVNSSVIFCSNCADVMDFKLQAFGKHIVARIEKLLSTGMKLSQGALPLPSDHEIEQMTHKGN